MTFVDSNRRAIATIHRNLEATQLVAGAEVVQRDAFRFIQEGGREPYDIVYVAPPQYQGLWSRSLTALQGSSLVMPETLVVVQIYPKEFEPLELRQFVLSDQRTYGSTMLCFYVARSQAPPDSEPQSHSHVG